MFLQHFSKTLIDAVYVNMIHSIIGDKYNVRPYVMLQITQVSIHTPPKSKNEISI